MNNIPPPKNLYQQQKRKYEEEDLFDYNSKYDPNLPVDNKSILNLPVFSREEESLNLNKNKKKKITTSRWTTTKVFLPGLSTQIPYGLTEEELEGKKSN